MTSTGKDMDNNNITYASVRLYEATSTTPEPEEMDKFSCELLYITDPGKLQDVAVYGTARMRRTAFQRLAATGDKRLLALVSTRIGKVPPVWMSEYYQLYEPELVKEVVLLNKLSITDDVELSYYATGSPNVFAGVDRPSYQTWLKMGMPLMPENYDTLDAAAISIAQTTLLREDDLTAVDVIVHHRPDLMQNYYDNNIPLLLGTVVPDMSHVRWIADSAPQLTLTVSDDVQDALLLYYKCFMYVVAKYKENDERAIQCVMRVRTKLDPTRAAILLEHLGPLDAGQVDETVCRL